MTSGPRNLRAMSKRISIGLVLAIVLYVGLRALVLWTAFEDVVMPMFELYPMGTMAELKLRGAHFPLRYYYDNAAGQLVLGHLTIPFYALFGSSYLVLKSVPALLGLATLVVLWHFLNRHFSRVAANVGAVLFALAPSTLVRYSVVCSGNHFENLFFTTLFFWAFYRHHAGPRTRFTLALAAFTAGLAIFVFLGAIIPVGICAGMHVGLRGWRRALKDLAVAALGFFVGLLPLLVVNAMTSGRGLLFLDAKFGAGGGAKPWSSVLDRLGDFLGPGLVESGMFEESAGLTRVEWGSVFVVTFAVAYVASVPSVVRAIGRLARGFFGAGSEEREGASAFERVKLVPFVLYLPLAALAFGISNFRLRNYVPPMVAGGYRYYLPALLFALILIAIWVARWWERRGAARVASVMLGGSALACGATSLALVDWSFASTGNGARYDGFNFAQMSRGFVSAKNALTKHEIIVRVGHLPDDIQQRVIGGLGFNLGSDQIEKHRQKERADWTLPLDDVLDGFPPEWHATMANGVGTALRNVTRREARTGDLPDLLRRVRPAEGPLAEEVTAGSACTNRALPFGKEVVDVFSENAELVQMEIPLLSAFQRGHGEFCGRVKRRGIQAEVERVETFRRGFAPAPFVEGWKRGAEGRER